MHLSGPDLIGRVTFVTGPERGCGKTTAFRRIVGLVRGEGARPALLTVGVESEGEGDGGGRRPRLDCRAGEVFVSTEGCLRAASCNPEILDLLPGSTALGRLVIARARRDGQVTLVGPERNEYAGWAIERILAERWADTVLVDGALNRITQVSSFPGARFLFVMRVGPGDLDRQLGALRRIHALATLPLCRGDEEPPLFEVQGPLTLETLARVPASARTIVTDDFTKVFLDPAALRSLLRSRSLVLRSGIEFGGFVVVLRDLSRERFLEVLDDPRIASLVAFNPYEAVHA